MSSVARTSLNLLLGMNIEKYIHNQQHSWLSGATGFNVSTVPASNNRLELPADGLETANLLYVLLKLFRKRAVIAPNHCAWVMSRFRRTH